MAKHAHRPQGIDEAVRRGRAGEGLPTLQGGVLCPYSWDTPWYWAWTGAYEATREGP